MRRTSVARVAPTGVAAPAPAALTPPMGMPPMAGLGRRDERICPACAELIRAEARVCWYCGCDFAAVTQRQAATGRNRRLLVGLGAVALIGCGCLVTLGGIAAAFSPPSGGGSAPSGGDLAGMLIATLVVGVAPLAIGALMLVKGTKQARQGPLSDGRLLV